MLIDMSDPPKVEPIVFHAHVTMAERVAARRAERAIGLRLLVLAVPLAWFELFPMRAWLELATGRPVSAAALVMLAGITLVLPLGMLLHAKRVVRSRLRVGTRYTLDDLAIRWSDKTRPWELVCAYRVEFNRDGRPERLKLHFDSGATRTIRLPIDDDARVDCIVAFVAARLPIYDETAHGLIDLPDALPRWTIAAIVVASLASLSFLAMRGPIARHNAEVTLWLIFAGSVFVPGVWYAIVRRMLNVSQRERAALNAFVCGMALLLAASCVTSVSLVRDAIHDLRAIPADVRKRVGKTISVKPRYAE